MPHSVWYIFNLPTPTSLLSEHLSRHLPTYETVHRARTPRQASTHAFGPSLTRSLASDSYEHIDTAAGYANAAGVAAALEKSGRARASYFVTSKVRA